MKWRPPLLSIVIGTLVMLVACDALPSRTTDAEREVHAVFVETYTEGEPEINLNNKTISLGVSMGELARCAPGVHFRNVGALQRGARNLSPPEITNLDVRTVDAAAQRDVIDRRDPSAAIRRGVTDVDSLVEAALATGMLSLSGVSFDSSGRYALMTYAFHCGGLCGHGATVVYERRGSGWQRTDLSCGMDWQS